MVKFYLDTEDDRERSGSVCVGRENFALFGSGPERFQVFRL